MEEVGLTVHVLESFAHGSKSEEEILRNRVFMITLTTSKATKMSSACRSATLNHHSAMAPFLLIGMLPIPSFGHISNKCRIVLMFLLKIKHSNKSSCRNPTLRNKQHTRFHQLNLEIWLYYYFFVHYVLPVYDFVCACFRSSSSLPRMRACHLDSRVGSSRIK